MKITKRQLRRIIREEKVKVLTENRLRRRVRRRLTENVDMVLVQQVADALISGEGYASELAWGHPAGKALMRPIEDGSVEIGPYTDAIMTELIKLGVGDGDANEFVDSLYQ